MGARPSREGAAMYEYLKNLIRKNYYPLNISSLKALIKWIYKNIDPVPEIITYLEWAKIGSALANAIFAGDSHAVKTLKAWKTIFIILKETVKQKPLTEENPETTVKLYQNQRDESDCSQASNINDDSSLKNYTKASATCNHPQNGGSPSGKSHAAQHLKMAGSSEECTGACSSSDTEGENHCMQNGDDEGSASYQGREDFRGLDDSRGSGARDQARGVVYPPTYTSPFPSSVTNVAGIAPEVPELQIGGDHDTSAIHNVNIRQDGAVLQTSTDAVRPSHEIIKWPTTSNLTTNTHSNSDLQLQTITPHSNQVPNSPIKRDRDDQETSLTEAVTTCHLSSHAARQKRKRCRTPRQTPCPTTF